MAPLLVAFAFMVGGITSVYAQTVIGSYPTMDGGFEGQSSIVTSSSIGTGTTPTGWSIQNTTTAVVTLNTTGGRSGPKYVTLSNGATAARFQSPAATPSTAVASSTAYTIQYYYKTAAGTAVSNFQPNISVDGTASPGTYASATMAGTSGVWTRIQASLTTASSAVTPRYGIGIIRLNGSSAVSVDIDDYVIYSGAADNSAPNSPTSVAVAQNSSNPTTKLDVSWGAPSSGGVDGGGYVVLRYAAQPNVSDDPNQNGIYALQNSITVTVGNGGTGNVGKVVYIGTGTSFTDDNNTAGLTPGTTYYYKVYTCDKAFNYSTEYANTGTSGTTGNSSPALTASTLASSLSNTYGTASTGVSFSAVGTNLSTTITVTPQSGWEIATTQNGTYQSSAMTGVANSTTLWVRNAASLAYNASNYNGSTCVVLSGGGAASSANITTSASGNTVSKKALTITGLSVPASKQYDRTTTAVVSGSASLQAAEAFGAGNASDGMPYTGDVLTLGGTPAATYNSATVAAAASVTYSGVTLGGAAAGNYSLTQQTTSTAATITTAPLTITGISISNKPFDGTTSATISGTPALSGVFSPDVVTIGGSPTASFVSSASANGISVTVSGYSITGADAGNYSLSQPTGLTANITSSPSLDASTASITGITYAVGGGPSTASNFTISGANLTGAPGSITITGSTNYEVSTTSASAGFSSTASVSYSSATLTASNVWVRLKSGLSVASYNGETISISGGGASTSLTASGTVTLATQTITFGALSSKAFGSAPFDLTASASSGLAVSYSSSNTAVATVSGSTVTVVGVGSTVITASQAGNGSYNAATNVTQTLTVTQASQTITFGTLTAVTFGGAAPAALAATASSGLAVSYASSNTSVATVSGTTITVVGAGSTNITASQAGNANYTAASNVIQALTVNQASQTITFGALSAVTYGGAAPAALAGTASSGLAVTYTSSNTAVATVSGTTITVVAPGTTTITAAQAGNTNYAAATSVDQTLTVNQASQTITFSALPNKASTDTFNLSATASSGLTVTYTSSNTSVATVSGSGVTIVGAGTTTITAAQAGNANYAAATSVPQTLTVLSTIAGWNFTGWGSGAGNAQAGTKTFNANLVSTGTAPNDSVFVTRGGGAAASAAANSFRTIGFQNNGIATSNTDYFQTTLTAKANYTLSLAAIDARLAGTGTFAASVSNQFAYSLDGTNFTLIGSSITTTTTPVTLGQTSLTGISALQNLAAGTTVTIRYYASGSTTTGGWGFSAPSASSYGFTIAGSVLPSSITPSVSTLSSFNYLESFGPSSSQTLNVSAANLAPASGNLTLSGSTNYEVSIDNSNFGSSVSIPYTGGSLSSYPIYIRLKSGVAAGIYNSQSVTISGGNAATSTITVSGSVSAYTSIISVKQGATSISSGSGTYSFGSVESGSSSSAITFTVFNTGTKTLTFSGTPKIAISGANASEFTINQSSTSSTVAATTGTTTYTITFSPTSTAAGKTATITIASDATNPSYTYTVTGTGLAPATPNINLQESGADFSGTYDFGSHVSGSSSSAVTFTIQNTGTASLSLTGSPKVVISGANSSEFSVNQSSTSASVAASGFTTFTITFVPTSLGSKSASISIASNDPNSNPTTFSLSGTAIAATASDIITNGGYGYQSNIAYASYQVSSSLTSANTIGVQGITLRDGGGTADADNLPTTLTAISFSTGSSTAIRSAALFDGTTNLSEVAVNGATTIAFTGLNVSATDGGNKNLELRVTYMSTVTDNQQIVFTVTSATASAAGSDLATSNGGGAVSMSTSDINRLEVTATKIQFVQQPTTTFVSTAISPAITVLALDANNNTDVDFVGSIAMTAVGGTISASSTLSATAVAGLATFSNIKYDSTDINLVLRASYSGFSNVNSSTFNVIKVLADWTFTNATDSITAAHLTADTAGHGNDFGTIAQFRNSTSVSSAYTGASGANNAGLALNSTTFSTSTNPYYQFKLTPDLGFNITVTSITFGTRSTSSGPKAFALRSSIDNYATDLATGVITANSVWALQTPVTTQVTSVAGTPVIYRLYGYNSTGAGGSGTVNWRVDDVIFNGVVNYDPTPIVYTSVSSLTSFSQNTATPSATQTYTVTANYLDSSVIVTAPTGYEVSKLPSSGFASTLTLPRVGGAGADSGNVAGYPVTVYVRLNSVTTGTISGSITNSSTGAVTASVSVSGSRTVDYYNTSSTDVTNVSNWSSNSTGIGGTHPSNFTAAGQTFHINNGVDTVGSAWTVSGSGSKVILGNGTTAVSLNILPSASLTGTIDLSSNSTLKLQNSTISHTYGTIATGTTIDYAQNTAFTVPSSTVVAYKNLILSGSGTKLFSGSNTYAIAGNLTINGATYDGSSSAPFASISLAGNLVQTGTVTPPVDANSITLSMTGTSGSTQTITGDGVSPIRWFTVKANTGNSTTIKLVKTGSTNVNLKVGNATGGGITLVAGSVLDLNGNDLTYANASGVGGASLPTLGTISTTSTSTISLFKSTSTTLGTLNLTTGSNTLGNLTVNYTGAAATALTLGTAVNLTGVLTVTSGNFNTAGLLTMKSTSIANSAILGVVGGTITGTATVERYIPKGFRAYRDLSASGVYSASNYLYNTWQESGSYANRGYGIFITGILDTIVKHNLVDVNTGIDHSLTGNPSAFYYRGGWDTVKNSKTELLNPYQSYRVLIRGDRSFDLDTSGVVMVTGPTQLAMNAATTLRATGNFITGNVTYTTSGVSNTGYSNNIGLSSSANGYTYVANPYDAPIDFHNIYTNSRLVNISPKYYYLDPTIGSTGAYVSYNAASDVSSNNAAYGHLIQAGQGFLIGNTSTSPSLTITEADKSVLSTSRTAVFGATPSSKLVINLLKQGIGANSKMDGAIAVFGTQFSNTVGLEDNTKMSNASDNLSIIENGQSLSIDARLPATTSDVLGLGLGQLSGTTYQLEIDATAYTINGVVPYLNDAYKKTSVALTAGINTIDFIVDTKVVATYQNRFSIVFKPTTLAVNSLLASATANGSLATIKWNTVGENGVSHFVVEKSIDGKNFTKIGLEAAKNTSTASYMVTDKDAVSTTSYYRIKAISTVGTLAYSNIVKLTNDHSQLFSIYPNPLIGKTLNVQLGNVVAGKYSVSITNALGQRVSESTLAHAGGSGSQTISVNGNLVAGVYQVTIRSTESKQVVYTSNLSVN